MIYCTKNTLFLPEHMTEWANNTAIFIYLNNYHYLIITFEVVLCLTLNLKAQ